MSTSKSPAFVSISLSTKWASTLPTIPSSWSTCRPLPKVLPPSAKVRHGSWLPPRKIFPKWWATWPACTRKRTFPKSRTASPSGSTSPVAMFPKLSKNVCSRKKAIARSAPSFLLSMVRNSPTSRPSSNLWTAPVLTASPALRSNSATPTPSLNISTTSLNLPSRPLPPQCLHW